MPPFSDMDLRASDLDDAQREALRAFVEGFDLERTEREEITTTNRRTRLARVRLEGFDGPLLVKTYWLDPSLSTWRKLGPRLSGLGRHLAQEAYDGARLLEAAGIPTTRVLAWWCDPEANAGATTHVLYEEVPADYSLQGYRYAAAASDERRAVYSRLVGETVDLVRRMHDGGVRHGSLELGNVLVRFTQGPEHEDGETELALIDTDRVRRARVGLAPVKRFFDLHDLSRLDVDEEGRRFLLTRYLGTEQHGAWWTALGYWRMRRFRWRKWLRRRKRAKPEGLLQPRTEFLRDRA